MISRRATQLIISVTAILLSGSIIIPASAADHVDREILLEARVTAVLEERVPGSGGDGHIYQKLGLEIISGERRGEALVVEVGILEVANLPRYETGDEVVVLQGETPEGEQTYYIIDYIRHPALLWIFVLFICVALLVAGRRALTSLVGLAISFLILFKLVLPGITSGASPVASCVLAAAIILPVTFCLSHGINRKTLAAITGTGVALVATYIIAAATIAAARLTGFGVENAAFLQFSEFAHVDVRNLLLAGIIISLLGILDDVTISQAAVVQQLRETNVRLSDIELYRRAMRVGQDHIASMVNTLILVYAGASLPLLLIFLDGNRRIVDVINDEMVATEIVRSLVASTGLILAVPLTTMIAVKLFSRKRA